MLSNHRIRGYIPLVKEGGVCSRAEAVSSVGAAGGGRRWQQLASVKTAGGGGEIK